VQKMLNRRQLALGSVAFAMGASVARAQSWPSRPIQFVVPLAAGGGVDMMARILADKLGQALGERIVVENQGGAGGTIAAGRVARSAPDGYTFIFQSVSSAVINPLVYKNLSYDPVGSFAPVTLFTRFPLVAATNVEIPAKNLQEFIALLWELGSRKGYSSRRRAIQISCRCENGSRPISGKFQQC
jgi:tripartite-type tricarboxylate transporter receptor subunit TctC